MSFESRARRWLAGLGLLMAVATAGCQELQVTDLPGDTAATPVATVSVSANGRYDLAISAVDMDKPGPKNVSDAVTLLAVVENKGTEAASQVQVEGRLYDGTGKELLLKKSDSVERLAAGESKVVRFKTTDPLPLRDGYIIRVEAVPLNGETNLSNNSRVLRAQVQLAPRQ